jgi:CheY-like chemotaxis protein
MVYVVALVRYTDQFSIIRILTHTNFLAYQWRAHDWIILVLVTIHQNNQILNRKCIDILSMHSNEDSGININIDTNTAATAVNVEKKESLRKRVLIVDDEPDVTLALSKGLEEYGFGVDSSTDSMEALSNFKENTGVYDIILLDVRMPKMNGFELYQEMRKIVGGDDDKKLKVCFMTAYEVYYESLKKDFPSLNIGCFIKKPIGIVDLLQRINQELST